jgi:exodeoxyribonuclease VII large subunit
LDDARRGLERRGAELNRGARRRLEAAVKRLSPAEMSAAASRSRVRLTLEGAALEASARARLEGARARLSVAVASLDAMSPLAVLGRGYALAQDAGGKVLRSTRGVRAGERVSVRLSEGALSCRVEEVEGLEGNG